MNRADLRLLVGVVLAVAVPAAVLDATTGEARRTAGLSAAPFAWQGVLLAHLVAALPLALIVAGRVRRLPAVASAAGWLWVLLGVVTTGLGAALSWGLGNAVAGWDLGTVPFLLLRSLLAFVLVLPWCVAAIGPAAGSRPGPTGVAIGIGLGLAVLPCGLYADGVIASRTQEAAELLVQRRMVKAEGVVTGLCELGSVRPIGRKSPAEVRKWLVATVQSLRWQAERPVPRLAPQAAGLDRVVLLVQLERLEEAASLLRPLVPGDHTATLMLAGVYSNQARWAESDALYAVSLEKLLPLAQSTESARTACRTAFDGLADNARKDHRPADAETTLNRGLRELPVDAAHFHFQLGRHYQETGRFGLALEHVRTAGRLDPAGFGARADELLRQLRTATPGCLSGQPRSR
jgi:hypothetical protein